MAWRRDVWCAYGFFPGALVVMAWLLASAVPAAAQVLANAAVTTATAAVVAGPHDDRPAARPPAPGVLPPINEAERQSYGCLVGAGTAVALTLLAGPTETVLVVAGGLLVPGSRLVLWTALAGTVVSTACAAGALATPAVLRLWEIYHDGAQPAPQ